MELRKYSVIVFDLGNVLLPFSYAGTHEKLEQIEKGLGDKFKKFYADNYSLHRDFEAGKISKNAFIDAILKVLEYKVDSETFCLIFSDIFTVNENVVALLPILKKKYMLILLSNTNAIHQKYGWQNYEFLKQFDKLILSHEVFAVKPEKEIYKAVEAFTQKPPEEHIFIDDIPEYANGAKKEGWDAINFKGYDNLVTELKLRNIF